MNHLDLLSRLLSFSISAHNSQPYRLRSQGDSFEIIVDHKCLLPIADPHLRDLLIGLGATLETFSIGLSIHGKTLSNIQIAKASDFKHDEDFVVATFSLATSEQGPSSLFPQLERRFSYRGKFTPQTVRPSDDAELRFLTSEQDKKSVGSIFDKVNLKFLSAPGYVEELYTWLRFSQEHPRWSRDGLNRLSMGLGRIDGMGASVILRPRIFRALNQARLAGPIIAEAPIIQSAAAVVAIVGKSPAPVEIGRGFMHGWLRLTEKNLFGAPLSLLTDDAKSLEQMGRLFKLRPEERIYNILRVGELPVDFKVPARARLSQGELCV